MFGLSITRSLVSGYTRQFNQKYIIDELITLCSKYFTNSIPEFKLCSNKPNKLNPKDLAINYSNKILTVSIENRNDENYRNRDPIYGHDHSHLFDLWWADIQDSKPDPSNSYGDRNKVYRNLYGISTTPWSKQNWYQIARNDTENDCIYKFKIKITKNFNSYGIGIISDDHKYKYCICVEIHHDPDNVPESRAWAIIKHKEPKTEDNKGRHHTYTQKRNEKRILLPKVGDNLYLTLNYHTNTIEFFCNDIKMESAIIEHIKNVKDVAFYPTFCFIPNLIHTDNRDIETRQASEFEIETCCLDKITKQHINVNKCIVDIGFRDNVFSFNNWLRFINHGNWISLSVLDIELTGFMSGWGQKTHQIITEPKRLFDLLWTGYYINFIDLKVFNDKLENLMDKIWENFDEDYELLLNGRRDNKYPNRWDKYNEKELYTLSYKWEHVAFIIVHLWTLIEMFQHFRNEYNALIYKTLYNDNSAFKNDEKISDFVTNIINNYVHQNFGDNEFEKCFRNKEFYRKFSKIYMRSFSDCGGSHMMYLNEWLDENILCKLDIPKEWMIAFEYVSDTSFSWKYYYISKETIRYSPGIHHWDGEDIKGKGQKDWYCNPLILSHDIAKIFVYGIIHELYNDSNSTQQYATNNVTDFIATQILNYYITFIPRFKHWGTGHSKPMVKPNKIEFDDTTGTVIVTAFHDDDPNHENIKKYCIPLKNKWSINTCSGVWKRISVGRMRKDYVHKLEMKCTENFNNFAIGIKGKESSSWLLCVEQNKNEKKAKLYIVENVSDDANSQWRYGDRGQKSLISQFTRQINELEVKKQEVSVDRFECGDTLSLILQYNEYNATVTFYYNNKKFYTVLADKYPEYTEEDAKVLFYHPLIAFKSQDLNKNNEIQRVSKYKITLCHLMKLNHKTIKKETQKIEDQHVGN